MEQNQITGANVHDRVSMLLENLAEYSALSGSEVNQTTVEALRAVIELIARCCLILSKTASSCCPPAIFASSSSLPVLSAVPVGLGARCCSLYSSFSTCLVVCSVAQTHCHLELKMMYNRSPFAFSFEFCPKRCALVLKTQMQIFYCIVI